MDRTDEFMTMARSLPPSSSSSSTATGGGSNNTVAAPMSGRYNRNDPAFTELRTFHTTASTISKDIAATSHMLAELTKSVKTSSSLFAEESDQQHINSLVVRIKSSIESLNGRIDEANTTLKYQKRRLNSQAGQEAMNLVIQLKEEFVEATTGFKKVLQERTDNMKGASEQKAQVYGGEVDFVSLDNKPAVYGEETTKLLNGGGMMMGGAAGFPTLDLTSSMSAGEPTGPSTLPRPSGVEGGTMSSSFSNDHSGMRMRRSYGAGGGDPSSSPYNTTGTMDPFSMGGGSAPMTPLDIQRMEQESGQQMQLIPDQTYLRERADAMSTVESNIVELGTIFNKLAVMVSEHREMVERVEDNVEEANMNLTMSMDVLTNTLNDLRSNRALMTKLFGVFVGFIIMFIIFFA